jgi:type IV pilus assembly protein PilW
MRLKLQQGFTLIELMISSVIGIVLLGGIMNVLVSSQEAHHASASQTTLTIDAGFAIHLIKQDLQMAGSFGRVDLSTLSINNPFAGSDCAKKWFANISLGVMGFNNSNLRDATCITSETGYVKDTDTLEVRYAGSELIPTGVVIADTKNIYIGTTPTHGELFLGSEYFSVLPKLLGPWAITKYKLQSVAYYISDHTDFVGDGYPSLRRIRHGGVGADF